MTFTIAHHCLQGAQFLPSSHYNERPKDTEISLLVIHNISLPPGQFGTGDIQAFFTGQLNAEKHPYFMSIADLKVASHLLIDRLGRVTQFVPFDKRAWHAGQSQFQGRENCNDFSIGIELEGTDDVPYTQEQYQTLVTVTNLLLQNYTGITLDRIVGHSNIAPGRKTDPGPSFNWQFYKQNLLLCDLA